MGVDLLKVRKKYEEAEQHLSYLASKIIEIQERFNIDELQELHAYVFENNLGEKEQ